MSFDGSSKTLVVGAGPSGIAAVGALIARSVPVHWVDPSFEVGALQRYCDVPANTKLSILVDQLKNFIPQATAMLCKGGAAAAAFERMITTAQHIPASEFDSCQLGWVRLGAVAEVMAAFTAELRTHPLVTSERGVVASLCPTAGGGYVATVERPRWGEIGSEIEGDIGSEIEREIDNEIGGEIDGEIISAVEIRVDSEDVGGVRRGEGVDSGMRGGGGGGGKMGVVANSARSLGSPPLQPQLSSSSCDDVPCGSSPASRGRYHAAVLAVGGKPVEMPRQMLETGDELGAEGHGRSPVVIPLEEALQLDKLSELVEPDDVVGVVGGGHSGLVVASNLLEVLGVACVRLFVRRPVQLAHWDESKSEYGAWGFRGLKGLAASFAIDYGLVGREPSACVDDECDDELQLLDVALLATPGAQVDKLVYCVGYECVPLDMLESSVELTGRTRSGQLTGVFGDGEPLQHLYGTGVGFADVEFSSGMPYPEVSFKRFTQRARCISEEIARSVAQIAC